MADKERKLTQKEIVFISEYLVDFNGKRAAEVAGYSKKTARQIAKNMLVKPYIQDAIKFEVDRILANNRELALRVVRECEKIAFGKISDVMRFNDEGVTLLDSDEIDTSTIESISFDETHTENGVSTKKRVKRYSKEKALEILAKYTALYSDAPKIDLNLNTDDEAVKALMEKHGVSKSQN